MGVALLILFLILGGTVLTDVNEAQHGDDATDDGGIVQEQRLARDDVNLLAGGVLVIFKDAVHHLVAVTVGIDQNTDAAPGVTFMQPQQITGEHGLQGDVTVGVHREVGRQRLADRLIVQQVLVVSRHQTHIAR